MKNAARIGFPAALISFIAAAGYSAVQLLQILGILAPPWDEILIYSFSLGIAPPFLVAMLAFHYSVPEEKRMATHGALLFATMYTLFACLVYVVQLAVSIPASRAAKTSGIGVLVLTQHSLFWTLDALAYIMMGISTFFAAFACSCDNRQRWLRRFLLINGLFVPVIAFVYFYPQFSIPLLLAASPWIITCPGSILLIAIYFYGQGHVRKAIRPSKALSPE